MGVENFPTTGKRKSEKEVSVISSTSAIMTTDLGLPYIIKVVFVKSF
jgi:hypothetical protein